MKYKWLKKGFVLAAAMCLAFSAAGCAKGKEMVDTVLEKTNLKDDETAEKETEKEETVPEVDVEKPEFTTNLSGSVTYKKGEKAEPLKVEATTTDSGKITYQWYSSQTNTNGGGTMIEGATQSTYTPPTNQAGTMYYYAVATSTIEKSTNGVTSETAEVVVSEEEAESEDTKEAAGTEDAKTEETKTEETKTDDGAADDEKTEDSGEKTQDTEKETTDSKDAKTDEDKAAQ